MGTSPSTLPSPSETNVGRHYAAATADTWSSELGILSKRRPFLITTFKTVPPGTNGGVSVLGLFSAACGGALIGIVCAFGLPFCSTQDLNTQRLVVIAWSAVMGLIGSIVRSLIYSAKID